MFSTANTFKITLPSSEEIVFGVDDTDSDWVGLVGPNGVTSSVELQESRTSISRGDGEIIGQAYWGSRSIVIDIFIPEVDPTARANYIRKLQKVTTMIRQEGLLSWTEQGTGTPGKQIPVRLQSFPTLSHNAGPNKTYQIVLTATQPQIDSSTLSTAVDKAASTNHTITNAGDWDAYPYIKIKGDFTACRLRNTTTGETLEIAGASVSNTQWVSIYTAPNARRVLRESSTTSINYYDKLVLASDFIRIQPGNNTFILDNISGGTPTAPTFSLSWRGAYM